MQTLKLADDLFPKLRDGSKRGTIRTGKREIEPGELWLEAVSGDDGEIVQVERITYTMAARLRPEDAALDGYSTVNELWGDLKRFYPSIAGSDLVTVVEFAPRRS